jgi:hypothetical protein
MENAMLLGSEMIVFSGFPLFFGKYFEIKCVEL